MLIGFLILGLHLTLHYIQDGLLKVLSAQSARLMLATWALIFKPVTKLKSCANTTISKSWCQKHFTTSCHLKPGWLSGKLTLLRWRRSTKNLLEFTLMTWVSGVKNRWACQKSTKLETLSNWLSMRLSTLNLSKTKELTTCSLWTVTWLDSNSTYKNSTQSSDKLSNVTSLATGAMLWKTSIGAWSFGTLMDLLKLWDTSCSSIISNPLETGLVSGTSMSLLTKRR